MFLCVYWSPKPKKLKVGDYCTGALGKKGKKGKKGKNIGLGFGDIWFSRPMDSGDGKVVSNHESAQIAKPTPNPPWEGNRKNGPGTFFSRNHLSLGSSFVPMDQYRDMIDHVLR
jgi:hypothetical protein